MRASIRIIVLAAAATFAACGSYSTVPPDGQGSGGSATGKGPGGSSTGKGGGGSAATSSSSGGGGGGQPSGHRAADLVAAGNRSAGSTYTAVSSLGEGPGGNGVSRSPKYQLVGGLIAAVTQP